MTSRRDWLPALLLIGLVLLVFYQAVLGRVFSFGDIYQLHLPLRSAYAAALKTLSLPLWTPNVLSGYPLLAEGQLGPLYPPNLLLHYLLPVPVALDVFVIGHFVFAGLGAFALARRLRLQRIAALCSGIVYALGGFLIAHLNHVNILACASWLPWLFLLTDRLVVDSAAKTRQRDFTLLALVTGMEFLAGHPQIALLTILPVIGYGVYLTRMAHSGLGAFLRFLAALLLGIGLAAAQLLPTFELTQLSTRAGGLDPDFFTSFSMHPLYLFSLLWPFALGNPYPNSSIELVAYVGWLPLLLATVAPWAVRRHIHPSARSARRVSFFVILALVGLLLSLGRWNPAYMLMLRLPLFSFFRVPGRYLYWFAFAVAMLAGAGLDAFLVHRDDWDDEVDDARGWAAIFGLAILALLVSARIPTADAWVAIWTWLPLVLGILSATWLAWASFARQRLPQLRASLGIALIVADLLAFGSVFSLTYNQTQYAEELLATPRSLAVLRQAESTARLYTHEEIVPVQSVMRESIYPNLSLTYDIPAANGLFPLQIARYSAYMDQLSPKMLDLLGITHFVIPQVLPVDEASEYYDVEDPFALNPVGRLLPIPQINVAALRVESYLSHSVALPDGQPVADIVLSDAGGHTETLTLRAGWHTSEWAYSRSDVQANVRHQKAAVARSWPARSGFPPEDHPGLTYSTELRLAIPLAAQSIEVVPLVPQAYLRIERMVLIDLEGNERLLAHLLDRGDHTLAYRSEDAAVYVNHDALPRAFIVHDARAVPDDVETLRLLSSPDFAPSETILIADAQASSWPDANPALDQTAILSYESHRVVVQTSLAANGYLLLTDTWYPGWKVRVDGLGAPLLRADLTFRAVALPPGEHVVEFYYEPHTVQRGLTITALTALALVLLLIWGERRRISSMRHTSAATAG